MIRRLLYGTATWDRIFGIAFSPNRAALCAHVTNPEGTLTALSYPVTASVDTASWDGVFSASYRTLAVSGDLRIVELVSARRINGADVVTPVFPSEWITPVASTLIGQQLKVNLRRSKRVQTFIMNSSVGDVPELLAESGDSGSLVEALDNHPVGFVSGAKWISLLTSDRLNNYGVSVVTQPTVPVAIIPPTPAAPVEEPTPISFKDDLMKEIDAAVTGVLKRHALI